MLDPPSTHYQSVDHISHAKYMRRESTHCSITLELAFSIRRVHEVRVWEGDGKDGGLGYDLPFLLRFI